MRSIAIWIVLVSACGKDRSKAAPDPAPAAMPAAQTAAAPVPKLSCDQIVPASYRTGALAKYLPGAILELENETGATNRRNIRCELASPDTPRASITHTANCWVAPDRNARQLWEAQAEQFKHKLADQPGTQQRAFPGIGRGAQMAGALLVIYDDDTYCELGISLSPGFVRSSGRPADPSVSWFEALFQELGQAYVAAVGPDSLP